MALMDGALKRILESGPIVETSPLDAEQQTMVDRHMQIREEVMSKYLQDQPAFAPAQPVIQENPNAQWLGTDAQPFDFPPGPAWNHTTTGNMGRISNLNEFAIPGLIIDAMVAAGFIRPSDRSDRELIKDGLRRMADTVLKPHLIAAMRHHEKIAAADASSWGHSGQGR